MKLDSVQAKSLFIMAAELVELTQRDPMKYLGKPKKIKVIDEDALEQANLNAYHDETIGWGIPDETRDATDYEPA